MGLNTEFEMGGITWCVRVGLFEDGRPAEIFIDIDKDGSPVAGWADNFAIAVSLCLQYGVPVDVLCEKFKHVRFEPDGVVKGLPEIRMASSPLDYIFKWLEMRFQSTVEG